MFSKKGFVIVLYGLGVVYLAAMLYVIYGDDSIKTWVDIPLHYWGGFAAGLFGTVYFQKYLDVKRSHWLFVLAFIIGFTALAGVVWEFYEWAHDRFVGRPQYLALTQPDLDDTMLDFVMDLLGGTTVGLLYLKRKQK